MGADEKEGLLRTGDGRIHYCVHLLVAGCFSPGLESVYGSSASQPDIGSGRL